MWQVLCEFGQTKQPFTLEEFGVDEQLQREEKHHQDDAGHQDAVESGAEQTHLPQGYSAAAAGLQPVGSAQERHKTRASLGKAIV